MVKMRRFGLFLFHKEVKGFEAFEMHTTLPHTEYLLSPEPSCLYLGQAGSPGLRTLQYFSCSFPPHYSSEAHSRCCHIMHSL